MPSKAEQNLKTELFLLRDDEGPILYAPLRRLSARLNEAAVGTVARYLRDPDPDDVSEDDRDVIRMLEKHGFFEPAPVPHVPPEGPVHVTLFPTDGCNLRCRYCYAGAEKQRHVMPVQAGKDAVDLVIGNAKEQGKKDIEVSFHGNGEPFTAFHVVKEVGEYAMDRAEEEGLICHLNATSNGVMSDEALDWVMAWIEDITISFDGLEELQNAQRPMAGGGASFPAADRTLRRLNEAKKGFSIRTTLTADSVEKLVPLALAVADRYPACRLLHIEPSWESGRSLSTGMKTPDPYLFAKNFLEADRLLRGKLQLVYSADRVGFLETAFCGAARNGFTVTAEGNVTACYEQCEPSSPAGSRFIYGRWIGRDGKDGKDGTDSLTVQEGQNLHGFEFDEEKLNALHTLTVDHMPYCSDCFCKYTCCGDCPAKLLELEEPETHHGSPRCVITRILTQRRISDSLCEETGVPPQNCC